ncbi:MAG: hypothetical protein R6U55_03185, partial [Desulfovermiculus sp.]
VISGHQEKASLYFSTRRVKIKDEKRYFPIFGFSHVSYRCNWSLQAGKHSELPSKVQGIFPSEAVTSPSAYN